MATELLPFSTSSQWIRTLGGDVFRLDRVESFHIRWVEGETYQVRAICYPLGGERESHTMAAGSRDQVHDFLRRLYDAIGGLEV